MKQKRIYRNKNYWKQEAIERGLMLPSERLMELIRGDCWPTLKKEIPILMSILEKYKKFFNRKTKKRE